MYYTGFTPCKSTFLTAVAVTGGLTRSMDGSGQLHVPPEAVCELAILPRILFTLVIN